MHIKEIDIKSFGNIENKKFSLSSGFNLIYGPNESGKTTLLSFLVFMFYGTKIRKRNDKIIFKERYMPWNGKPMEGQVFFEAKGMEYVLRRTYSSERNFISLYCQSTGEIIKDAEILKSPGEYFLGFNSDTFFKSAYFSSLSAEINNHNSDEIITKLRNLFETAATEMSYKKISSEINNEISLLSSEKRKNAEIPVLERQVYDLKAKLSAAKDSESKIALLNKKIDDNNKKIHTLHSDLDELEDLIKNKSSLKEPQNNSNEKRVQFLQSTLLVLMFIISSYVYAYNMHIGTTFFGVVVVFLLVNLVKLFRKNNPKNKESKRKDFTIEQINDKMKLIQDEISHLRVYNAISTEQTNNLNTINVSELRRKLGIFQEELFRKKQRLDALNLAMIALKLGYNDMKTIFSPELSKNASTILALLTGGKYSHILVDDNFEISVLGENGYNSVNYLSRATLEQTYLALRFALVSLVCSAEKTPLILDDAFAFYDSRRRDYAFDYIMDLACTKQIIFATCKTEEYDFLANKNEINIIFLKN